MNISIIKAGGTRSRRWVLVTSMLGFVPPTGALGAQWIVQPTVDLAAFHDDNVELTTASQTSASGYILAPHLRVTRNTETSKLDLDANVAFTDYQRGDVEDRSESVATVQSYNQVSERATIGLDGELRRDSLFERISVGRGVGDLRDVDIGLTTSTRVRRTYVAANPYFNWLLSERSAMRVGYRLTDVGFSNADGTSLVDYKEHIVSGSYTRQLTEQNDVSVAANAIRYQPNVGTEETETYQLLLGVSRQFSESTRGSFAVGGSESTQTVGATEERSSGVVLRAELTQKSDISELNTVLSRDVTPSGIGRTLRTDQFRVRWMRKTAPTVDFVLEGQALRVQALEGTDPAADRRYLEVGPEIRWHWLEDWAVAAGYRYRRQKYDVNSNSADSNAVFLGVTYAL